MSRTYGRLVMAGDQWMIGELEPHVAIKLKALFPGVPKAARVASFPVNGATAADLAWFCDRYPLAMSAQDRHRLDGDRAAFGHAQAEAGRILSHDYAPPTFAGLRDGQQVRQHQARAVEILRLFGGLLVGDEVGKGKTYTAAAAMLTPGALPATVVCFPNLKRQWKQKIETFTTLSTVILEGGTPYAPPPVDVRIISYTTLFGWADVFELMGCGLVVFDEIHDLRRGVDTAKGEAAMRLAQAASMRLGLTATPIFNYGTEIWNVMQFIRPDVLGPKGDFYREFAPDGTVNDTRALGTYLRDQHAFVRELKDSPSPNVIVHTIDDYDGDAVTSAEDMARALAVRATTGTFSERGQATRELDAMMRLHTGVAKARAVAAFVRVLVEGGTPVLLFGWHRDVYDIWLKELKDLVPAMYTGTETPAAKAREAARFLNGETDILILSLRAGAGIDGLQARCGTVVFGELDWSPGQHHQCIGRVDREGQPLWDTDEPVTAVYLVVEDGSDPPIMEVLGLKASEASGVVDPALGVQSKVSDEGRLLRLVQRYLDKKPAAVGEAAI